MASVLHLQLRNRAGSLGVANPRDRFDQANSNRSRLNLSKIVEVFRAFLCAGNQYFIDLKISLTAGRGGRIAGAYPLHAHSAFSFHVPPADHAGRQHPEGHPP
jgi:hypothetical protein